MTTPAAEVTGAAPGPFAERLAPAKINLTLAITGRRPDGYHDLRSVFLRLGVSDRLRIQPADPSATADVLRVLDDPRLPIEGNLVLRALAFVRDVTGARLPPLEVTLRKAIPVAAGLGGGSSDAAAALEAACEVWGVGLAVDPSTVAQRLGADVPFFRAGAAVALVTGTGESVEPLPPPRGRLGALLVTPAARLATARVFAAHDALDPARTASGDAPAAATTDDLADALRTGLDASALAGWAERLADANDLWPAATSVDPALVRMRADLERVLDRPVLLSGSGPTLVALYASAEDASASARQLFADLPTSLHGARVVATDQLGPDPVWRSP